MVSSSDRPLGTKWIVSRYTYVVREVDQDERMEPKCMNRG